VWERGSMHDLQTSTRKETRGLVVGGRTTAYGSASCVLFAMLNICVCGVEKRGRRRVHVGEGRHFDDCASPPGHPTDNHSLPLLSPRYKKLKKIHNYTNNRVITFFSGMRSALAR
jgi:hypothetical protein